MSLKFTCRNLPQSESLPVITLLTLSFSITENLINDSDSSAKFDVNEENGQLMLDRANQSKRLTPKKYGFFARSAAMEGTNTAGEAMDDLLRAGGIGNLDDGFSTLDGGNSDPEDLALSSERKGKSDIDVESRATMSHRERSPTKTTSKNGKIQNPTAPVAT